MTCCLLVAAIEVGQRASLAVPSEHRLLLAFGFSLELHSLGLRLFDVLQAVAYLSIQVLSLGLNLLKGFNEAVLTPSKVT